MVPCLLGCSALGSISQPSWSGHAGLHPQLCQGVQKSPCCHPGRHQVMPPSCPCSACPEAPQAFWALRTLYAGPKCLLTPCEQRVGGAAILLQLQWQQEQTGSHPRVFRLSLSYAQNKLVVILLKFNFSEKEWSASALSWLGGFAEGVSDPAEPGRCQQQRESHP